MTDPIRDAFEYFFGCKRFAVWHRHWLPESFRAVDIDLVGTQYGQIAYVIESTTSAPDGKNCNVTRTIAKATAARGFVVQIPKVQRAPDSWVPWRQVADYIIGSDHPEFVTVRQVYPPPEWTKRMSWTQFKDTLQECRTTATVSRN